MTAEIQDPRTGQWVPYVPGDANDNGRGNIRLDGQVYSYYGGQAAYQQQQAAAPPPAPYQNPYPGDPGPIPTNPDGSQIGGGEPLLPGQDHGANPPGYHWDPNYAMFLADDNPVSPGPAAPPPAPVEAPPPSSGGGGGGAAPSTPGATWNAPGGLPATGFGAAPPTYQSDPNAPVYTPLPEYKAPTWTGGDFVNPSEADLQVSPGYQARLDQLMKTKTRAAAAQGTILSGGTLQALDRSAQDYASNEYQTFRNNALDAYKQRYSQFTDAAGMDLNARTINANQNQQTFANRTATYNTSNARTLSDYLTNVTAQRNAELDYWNRLQDVNQTGANLAGGSYRA